MKEIFKSIVSWPVFLLLLLNIIPSVFLSQLIFDNAPEVYLPADQPGVVLKNELAELFPGDQNAIILFHGKALYSDQFLDQLQAAVNQLERNSMVERVLSVIDMEHIEGTDDGFEVSELLGKEQRKVLTQPGSRYQWAKSDRIAHKLTVADNADYMAMVIRPHQLNTTTERMSLMNQVYDVLSEHHLSPYIVASAGPIVVEIEQFRSMVKDTLIFVPGTIIIGLMLIWLMFKRILAVLVAGLLTGAVINTSLLLFVIFSLPYTMISVMLAPLLASLTTAFLVHFYTYMKLSAAHGYEGIDRVNFAIAQIKKPAFFTALTTALGLGSLAVSPILPIGHFGLIAAFGVMLLFSLVIWVVPLIFVQFDKHSWPQKHRRCSWMDKLLKLFVDLAIRRSGWVIAITIVLFFLGIPFVFKVSAETNLLKFFPENHFVNRNTQLIEAQLSGVMPLEVILYGSSRDSMKKLHNLKQIEQLQRWLQRQAEIDKTISLVDFLQDMHQAMNPHLSLDNVNDTGLPENNALISQYFLIYDGDDVYELVNREFNVSRIVLSSNVHNSAKIRELIDKIETYLANNMTGMEAAVAGEGRLFADQDKLLITGQISSLILVILLIFLIMLYLWKSYPAAVLSLLPNLSPILAIFMFMGILGIWLDMATAMIASVAIGIAVDDTIHLLHGYYKRLENGHSVIYSLAQSYFKTGRALLATTLILCAQFFLVSLSQFVPTAHFGMLTAVGLLMALLFDLLLLPALIVVFYRWKHSVNNLTM